MYSVQVIACSKGCAAETKEKKVEEQTQDRRELVICDSIPGLSSLLRVRVSSAIAQRTLQVLLL